jgi:penicillin-binding protein 2
MSLNQITLKSLFATCVLLVSLAGLSFRTVIASGHPAKRGPDQAQKRVPSDRRGRRSGKASAKETRKSKRQQQPIEERRAVPSRRQSITQRLSPLNNQRSGRALLKRQRVAEIRRNEARRRAEATRLAAIARQRARDDAMRNEVQSFIERDNVNGEDSEVRRAAMSALGNHAGTVVVMDPKTGRVYSIVNQEWAVRRGFKPCSTIKLVTGLAGLNEKVIDPTDTANVSDTNRIDLTSALAYSNNTYFQQVGGRIGFEKMISYARRLGLGEKTGINAPNEFPGQMPAPRAGYAVNHMSSHGDDFKVTALQLATLVSAMANGGKLLSPTVPLVSQDATKFQPKVRRLINLDVDSLRYMVPGMVGAVNYGSGKRAHDPQATVAGKTGTCIEHGTWVGLFASYAPLVNPRLAVVVIARGADAHSHFPAAVAGRIYRDLNGRFGTPTNLQIAATRADTPDITGVRAYDPKATLNEEDQDEAAENAEELGAGSIDRTTRSTTRSANSLETSVTAVTTTATATHVSQPLWRDTNRPANAEVKRVLLPVPNRTETKRPAVGAQPAPRVAPQLQTRPRRVVVVQR